MSIKLLSYDYKYVKNDLDLSLVKEYLVMC